MIIACGEGSRTLRIAYIHWNMFFDYLHLRLGYVVVVLRQLVSTFIVNYSQYQYLYFGLDERPVAGNPK